MAAPYNPPVKNEDFVIGIALEDMSGAGLRANPTIAAGDFKISKDFGAFANLTTLPSVAPAGSAQVMVTLSAAEMNADVVTIQAIDQTNPKEWADFFLCIPTTAA